MPSFRKYWREHSVGQIVGRIWNGALDQTTKNLRVIAYYKFGLALLMTALVLSLRATRQIRDFLSRNAFAALFCLLFLAGYFILYAWYDTIINDSRFILSIFLPFLFASSIFILRVGRDRVMSVGGRRLRFDQFFAVLLLGLSAIDVIYNAPNLLR